MPRVSLLSELMTHIALICQIRINLNLSAWFYRSPIQLSFPITYSMYSCVIMTSYGALECIQIGDPVYSKTAKMTSESINYD